MKKFVIVFLLIFSLLLVLTEKTNSNILDGERYVYTENGYANSINLGVFYETKTNKILPNTIGETIKTNKNIHEIFSLLNIEDYKVITIPSLNITLYECIGKNKNYNTLQIAITENGNFVGFPYILGSYWLNFMY